MTSPVDLLSLVREVPDYPSPGIVFRDITPLLADAAGLAAAVAALAGTVPAGSVDVVAGIEARGFILGAPLALALGVGFVPVRKAGKLPGPTLAAAYALEYGEAVLEVHTDAFAPGSRVLVLDDVLATGGTIEAALGLVRRAGATPVAATVLMELSALGGRARVAAADPDLPLRAVLEL